MRAQLQASRPPSALPKHDRALINRLLRGLQPPGRTPCTACRADIDRRGSLQAAQYASVSAGLLPDLLRPLDGVTEDYVPRFWRAETPWVPVPGDEALDLGAGDTCEIDWDGLADPLHAWHHLLELEPVPLPGGVHEIHLHSLGFTEDTKFRAPAHDLTVHGAAILQLVQSELSYRDMRLNSSAVTWRHLLEASSSDNVVGNSLIGAFLFGLGDVASQVCLPS